MKFLESTNGLISGGLVCLRPAKQTKKAVEPETKGYTAATFLSRTMPNSSVTGPPELILDARPDNLKSACFVPPSTIALQFADGFSGEWSFRRLGLTMTSMKPATIRAARAGTSMEVQSKWNETVEVDSSSLRAAVDPKYAADLEAVFVRLRGPIEDLKTNAMSLPKC